MFYEMATGRRPFQGDSNISTLASILKETPPARPPCQKTLDPGVLPLHGVPGALPLVRRPERASEDSDLVCLGPKNAGVHAIKA